MCTVERVNDLLLILSRSGSGIHSHWHFSSQSVDISIILFLRQGVYCHWWLPIIHANRKLCMCAHRHSCRHSHIQYMGLYSQIQQLQASVKISPPTPLTILMTLLLNRNCCRLCCWAKRAACPVWYRSIARPVEVHLLYSCWTWARGVKGMREGKGRCGCRQNAWWGWKNRVSSQDTGSPRLGLRWQQTVCTLTGSGRKEKNIENIVLEKDGRKKDK